MEHIAFEKMLDEFEIDYIAAAIKGLQHFLDEEIIERLIERGAQGVIAGCTEIELLVGPDDVDTGSRTAQEVIPVDSTICTTAELSMEAVALMAMMICTLCRASPKLSSSNVWR